VATRLAAYQESTAPLIEFYRASGRLVEIDGELPVEQVFQRVITIIDESGGSSIPRS
jgi:adenylate kinase